MPSLYVALAIAAAFYAVVEALWLVLMRPFYASQFARFSRSPTLAVRSVAAAIGAYALLAVTFYGLVLRGLADRRVSCPWTAAGAGALYGLAVYGVYNATNKATLPGYPWAMVAVDTAWGATAFAAVAVVFLFGMAASRHPEKK